VFLKKRKGMQRLRKSRFTGNIFENTFLMLQNIGDKWIKNRNPARIFNFVEKILRKLFYILDNFFNFVILLQENKFWKAKLKILPTFKQVCLQSHSARVK
jgi:hypothetical protein